jgi:hypothetical protein
MDFSFFSKFTEKKAWWIDALFYLALALLLATLFCYGIFLIQAALTQQAIKKETLALQTVGTQDQKSQETTVIGYRKKLNDFSTLIKNHEFAANIFAFMEDQAEPYVWFQQFILDQKDMTVQLFGQTDTADDLSRQVNAFEQNDDVSKVSLLNSKIGSNGKTNFNLTLVLNKQIFQYIAPIIPTTSDTTSAPTITP